MIETKRIYDPASPDDGKRILVMRYWPRGVRKSAVDAWMKDLGTDPDLIRLWKASKISWEDFRERYREGLRDPRIKRSLDELVKVIRDGERVTLLCSCPDERRCHRSILKEVISMMARSR